MARRGILPLPGSTAARSVATIVLVLGMAVGPGVVAAAEDPRFEAFVPDPVIEPGAETQLTVQLVNDAAEVEDRVRTARNVRVEMRPGRTPITVKTGEKVIGSMPDGEVREVSFRIDVPEDIASGRYRLPIRLVYEHGPDERDAQRVHATVRVEERARFAVVDTRTNLSVDETGPITLVVRNVGSEAARDASVTLESRSAGVSFGGSASDTRFAGRWAPGETKTLTFEATVAENAERQRYALRATVSYDDPEGNAASSRVLSTGFVPRPEQAFDVVDVSSTLQVGQEGRLEGTLVNRGPDPVRNAVVVFEPESPNLQALETEYAVGDLGTNGSAGFSFQVLATDDAGAGPRQFSLEVRYRDRRDEIQQSDPIDVRTRIANEQTFDVREVRSTLRVGEQGTLEGVLVNAGEAPARNAVVIFESENPNVNPIETEYSIGDLAAGGRAAFSFSIEISEGADAGPRQFTVRVRYRDGSGEVRRTDPVDVGVEVRPKRDVFAVDPVNATVVAGRSGTVTLRVTNTANETVSDVSAKLFADDPLSSSDDEAFVDRLEPGESTTIVLGLGADGGALEKVYPASLDFQYDDADGDTLLSDTYRVPIRVERPQRSGVPRIAIVGAGIVVALAAVGFFLYRRR